MQSLRAGTVPLEQSCYIGRCAILIRRGELKKQRSKESKAKQKFLSEKWALYKKEDSNRRPIRLLQQLAEGQSAHWNIIAADADE